MPKIIELTVEIDVQKVSCPGVWLCQDGRVSLTVFALGTSYQTCLLPPMFPLLFKDIFYFRKRFQESCALNNICCLLKDETIYCELVQWCEDCAAGTCVLLAQYLGALNDVLFPPNTCSNDGVDLLMRRSKNFPGILSPKIEIATKVRIDEVWNQQCNMISSMKLKTCHCGARSDLDALRQKQVCHSAQYHRNKCLTSKRSPSATRSRSRSGGSKSCCSLTAKEPEVKVDYYCPRPITKSRECVSSRYSPPRRGRCCRQYDVYSVGTPSANRTWRDVTTSNPGSSPENSVFEESSERLSNETDKSDSPAVNVEKLQKLLLESRYIDQECNNKKTTDKSKKIKFRITPCVCEICKKYHELFHSKCSKS